MSKNRNNDGYDVGYGKPPKVTQFKKGDSGNPKGRPRKSKSQRSIAGRVLNEIQRLSGQPRGARVRYKTLELVVMTVKQLSAAGHQQAGKLYTRILEKFGTQHTTPGQGGGYIVVPERLTNEEWEARYSPKDEMPGSEEAAAQDGNAAAATRAGVAGSSATSGAS